MSLRNTASDYGSLSKFFHWLLFFLVLAQVYFILQANLLPKGSPWIGFLIGRLHKPLGLVILLFAILAYGWRLLNVHPRFPSSMKPWEKFAAYLVHHLLYLVLIIMPVSGLIMSTAEGQPPNFFGLYQIPQFIEKNKMIGNFLFNVHNYTAILLITLIVIHILAALKHHFIDRDTVLKRMLPF